MKNTCRVKECPREIASLGHCHRHYCQIRKYGKVTLTTRLSPTQYIHHGKVTYICIKNKFGATIAKTTIDTEDIEKTKLYKWSLKDNGYISGINKAKKRVYLHRLVIECPKGKVVNHRDFDGLNNRKSNLEICEQWQNAGYRRKTRGQHKYKGVVLSQSGRNWSCQIKINHKYIRISRLTSMVEAAYVYDQLALQLYNDFAVTNFNWN